VFLGRRLLRERPGQHKLCFEDRVTALHPAIQGRAHPTQNRMPQLALNIRDHLAGVGFIPTAIEVLGGEPQLHDEVARKVLRFDLAALLTPEPDQGGLVITHDNPGVGAADKKAAVYSVDFNLLEMFWHDDSTALVLSLDCGSCTCDNGTILCL